MGRIIKIAIILPILYIGAIFGASEWGGEVIELETQRDDGRLFKTSVWVVDFDGSAWLRAGNADAEWVDRLRAEPQVFVTRNGERVGYQAEIIDGLVGQVSGEMRKKYGRADELISTMHDSEKLRAIRLRRR